MNEAPLITPDSPHSDHKDYKLPGDVVIRFQKGAMELGRNGVTTEELLMVAFDHIMEFQQGKFKCVENDIILGGIGEAIRFARLRADRRKAEGVKGRDQEHLPKDEPEEPLLQWFMFAHLPEKLRMVSAPFAMMAMIIVETTPRNPERTVALRKLLEAKDCAVRAALYKQMLTEARLAAKRHKRTMSSRSKALGLRRQASTQANERSNSKAWLGNMGAAQAKEREAQARLNAEALESRRSDLAMSRDAKVSVMGALKAFFRRGRQVKGSVRKRGVGKPKGLCATWWNGMAVNQRGFTMEGMAWLKRFHPKSHVEILAKAAEATPA